MKHKLIYLMCLTSLWASEPPEEKNLHLNEIDLEQLSVPVNTPLESPNLTNIMEETTYFRHSPFDLTTRIKDCPSNSYEQWVARHIYMHIVEHMPDDVFILNGMKPTTFEEFSEYTLEEINSLMNAYERQLMLVPFITREPK